MAPAEVSFLTRETLTLHSPSCLHELLGTLEGPCVETSRSNPRNTPNTLRAMLDSGIFGSVMFPLWEKEKTAVSRSTSSADTFWYKHHMKESCMILSHPTGFIKWHHSSLFTQQKIEYTYHIHTAHFHTMNVNDDTLVLYNYHIHMVLKWYFRVFKYCIKKLKSLLIQRWQNLGCNMIIKIAKAVM